jgi:hypothetical protein
MLVNGQFKVERQIWASSYAPKMLAITTNSHDLPQFIIFRRETPKRQISAGIIVRVQHRVWMTKEISLEWIINGVDKEAGCAMLVLDSFCGHMTQRVKSIRS